MAKFINSVPVSHAAGTYRYGPFNVQNNLETVRVSLSRCATVTPVFWASVDTKVKTKVYLSTDNGQTFEHYCDWSGEGGIIMDRRGASELSTVVYSTSLPAVDGRHFRLDVEITGPDLVTTLDAEAV